MNLGKTLSAGAIALGLSLGTLSLGAGACGGAAQQTTKSADKSCGADKDKAAGEKSCGADHKKEGGEKSCGANSCG